MQFGKLGAIFGRFGSSAGISVPTAPVLSMAIGWSSSDNTPDFKVVVDDTIAAGDSVTLQIQASGGAWSSLLYDTTNTISPAEDASDQIDFSLGLFSDGAYEARAKVHHGNDSPWSNTVSFTISTSQRLMWSTDQILWSIDHITWM